MSEELKSESSELIVLPIEEQISQELVKANVTEAIIADLKERLLSLKIAGIEDKETYLIVQAGRKECKALRVAAKKICTNGREQAVAISKAWIAKEKEVTGRISEVEDYLEKQEVEYEAEVAKEKEARKRKQEEQLITRQQKLSSMGVLYSDGNFVLGDVSFEMSLIKESEQDIWDEAILPKFRAEYEKVEQASIAAAEAKRIQDEEFKRQQEEFEQKKKELAEKEAELKREEERQAAEAKAKKEAQLQSRISQLTTIGFLNNGIDGYRYHEYLILHDDILNLCGAAWDGLLDDAGKYIAIIKAEEAEQKRKEQERKDLQNKRYAEMFPYKEFGSPVQAEALWCLTEDEYSSILLVKKSAYEHAEEEKKQKIADDAAKKERERIEEEQRQAEAKRITALGEVRSKILSQYTDKSEATIEGLGKMDELAWEIIRSGWHDAFEKEQQEKQEIIRKQEEERKAEELAQASEKVKWADIIRQLDAISIPAMRSSQYRRKGAILREKLEEIKGL